MPELPEVETVRGQLEPALVGRRFERVRDRRRAPRAPVRAGRGGGRARRGARRGGRAARQVSGCSVRERSGSPDPPPNDGKPSGHEPVAPGRSASPRCVDLDGGLGRRVPRHAALRHVAAARAGRRGAGSSRKGRRRATRHALHDRAARRAARRAAARRSRRRSSTSARSPDWGTSTSTRRCGGLALNPLRPAAGLRPERAAAAAPRHSRGARARPRPTGVDAPGLPAAGRQRRLDAERVPRLRTRDEPCDRCGTPIARTQVAGRRTWFCPTCQPEEPAQAARSSARRPCGRGARARCSRRSGRPSIRICGTVQPPVASNTVCRKRGSSSSATSSYGMPERLEERLRADAVAAPARRVDLDPGHRAPERLDGRMRSRPDAVPRLEQAMAGRAYSTEAVVLRSIRLR